MARTVVEPSFIPPTRTAMSPLDESLASGWEKVPTQAASQDDAVGRFVAVAPREASSSAVSLWDVDVPRLWASEQAALLFTPRFGTPVSRLRLVGGHNEASLVARSVLESDQSDAVHVNYQTWTLGNLFSSKFVP